MGYNAVPKGTGITPLSVGDKVPDLFFSNVLNYSNRKVRLSDFKGKLVILDFWATWCGACIHYFPKMDSLQERFPAQVQVLLVNCKSTRDSEPGIKAFLEKWNKRQAKKLGIPIIMNDSIADRLFPHQIIPHYVWLDAAGTVKAITSSDAVTAANIESVLAGNNTVVGQKKDLMDFDYQKPLFTNTAEAGNIKYRSLVTGLLNGLPSSYGSNSSNGLVSRIYCINLSIVMLYRTVFPEPDYPQNRIILNVKKPYRYNYPSVDFDNWMAANAYCYELILPATSADRSRGIMKDELDRFFGLNSGVEKRKIRCFILKSKVSTSKRDTRDARASNNLFEDTNALRYIQNQPLEVLVNRLNETWDSPVINESSFQGNISMVLPNQLSDKSAVKTALAKEGFEFEEEERELEMLVLTEL